MDINRKSDLNTPGLVGWGDMTGLGDVLCMSIDVGDHRVTVWHFLLIFGVLLAIVFRPRKMAVS